MNRTQYGKLYQHSRRLSAMQLVANGRPVCVYCGCDDLKLLEMNHKKGGGYKALMKHFIRRLEHNPTVPHRLESGGYVTSDILLGRSSHLDFEITCRVCNALHYLELKFGKLPFEVRWHGGAKT